VTAFAVGSVGHTLDQLAGVWLDRVEVFALDGAPLASDPASGSPGPAPFEQLVYIDFDGRRFTQTNVVVRGRAPAARTFTGTLEEGLLRFDPLGPGAPEHIGCAAGPGLLLFVARQVTEAWRRYHEPDFIRLLGPGQRTRTTLLYRDGVAVRSLTATGSRLAPPGPRRLPCDPRGPEGPVHALVHERGAPTAVFQENC
jgi:hypothetical protein